MKFSTAFLLAVVAVASAQDAKPKTIKEQLMEHRKDMFEHHAVS